MVGSGKKQWKLFLHLSPPPTLKKPQPLLPPPPPSSPPNEFRCPISGHLMSDPVIVPSGHTFERNCVRACISLSYTPTLSDGSTPDFSTLIPNLALKATILNWCISSHHPPPTPLDFPSALNLIRPRLKTPDLTPSPLLTSSRKSSSFSSSEVDEISHIEDDKSEEIVFKLKSSEVFVQEEGVVLLREMTRSQDDSRVYLCTPRLLSVLRCLIVSRYASLQVNSTAALVNLSLDNANKVKIVRSGMVPPLIEVLKAGVREAQEHAAGALFSLALDDNNKIAIGVLGALPPLLHTLRSNLERARQDSALALYHLSLAQSNQVKLVKLGSTPLLLSMINSGHMTGRIMMILCNLASSGEGRAAMLDGGAVECLVKMLMRDEFGSDAIRESCVSALHWLSQGGMRFKGLAKEAGAEVVLNNVAGGTGSSERMRNKARRILEMIRRDEEEEVVGVDWEELLNSDDDEEVVRA